MPERRSFLAGFCSSIFYEHANRRLQRICSMAPHAFQSEIYNLDNETLLEESIGTSQSKSPKFSQPRLGKRGLEWRDKLLIDISLRIRITRLKFLGKTKEEITHEEPGYYYHDEYHELDKELWYRRNKSMSDLHNTVGTA